MEYLQDWIFFTQVLASIIIIEVVLYIIICRTRRFIQKIRAHREVETLFLNVWDKSRTNEMLAWLKVQRQLDYKGAPEEYINAVKHRIEMCKERHRKHQTVHLQNGRVITISTLN